MKQIVLFCACLSTAQTRAFAGTLDTPGTSYPQVAIGIGSVVRPAFGQSRGAFILSTEVRLTKHWLVGLQADVTGKKATGTFGYSVEKPSLSAVTAGLRGGYRQGLGKRLGIEAHVLGGITTAVLQDRAESRLVYTGKTFIRQYKTVAHSAFFVAQPSLALSYRIIPAAELAASVGYDFAEGKSRWMKAADFSGPRASIMLKIAPPQSR